MNKRNGFNLLEVIIAVMILTVTIVAVTAMVNQNLRQNQLNQAYLVANGLSQEALEVARNMRDGNWLQNFSFEADTSSLWNESLWPKSGKAIYRLVKKDVDNLYPWKLEATSPANEENLLFYDSEFGYNHSNVGERTPFSRYLVVEVVNDPELVKHADLPPLKVTAVTEFTLRAKTRQVAYDFILTDWKQGPL